MAELQHYQIGAEVEVRPDFKFAYDWAHTPLWIFGVRHTGIADSPITYDVIDRWPPVYDTSRSNVTGVTDGFSPEDLQPRRPREKGADQ